MLWFELLQCWIITVLSFFSSFPSFLLFFFFSIFSSFISVFFYCHSFTFLNASIRIERKKERKVSSYLEKFLFAHVSLIQWTSIHNTVRVNILVYFYSLESWLALKHHTASQTCSSRILLCCMERLMYFLSITGASWAECLFDGLWGDCEWMWWRLLLASVTLLSHVIPVPFLWSFVPLAHTHFLFLVSPRGFFSGFLFFLFSYLFLFFFFCWRFPSS